MKVKIAWNLEKTRNITHQAPFPETTPCTSVRNGHRCNGTARLGFVAYENERTKKMLCHLYGHVPRPGKGRKKQVWFHDVCAVAVYFCMKCLEPTALYNQA